MSAPAATGWSGARLIIFGLLAALAIYALLFTYHAAHLAFAPGELNYAESTWLLAAVRARHGLGLYFDYQHAPYIPMVYPPFMPELAGLVGRLLNLSDAAMIPLARLEIVAATLVSAGAVAALCRGAGVGWPAAGLAALLFLTPSHTFLLWSFAARGDMVAVALGLGAVACVVHRPGGWGLVAGGVLAGLALAAKQTAVAPLLACAWWLLPSRRCSGLIGFGAGLLSALGLTLAPLGPEGLRLLARGTLDLIEQPEAQGSFSARFDNLITLFGLLIPVALVGATRLAPGPARGLLLRYTALAAGVLLVSAGKIGSASSYCLELIALLAVLAGVGVDWLLTPGTVPREALLAVTLLIGAPITIQTVDALFQAQAFREAGANDGALRALAGPGPILSEDGYIALHGPDPPFLLDPFYFSVLAAQGKWDPTPVRQMLLARRFTAVVLAHPLEMPITVQGIPQIAPGIYQAITQNYTFAAQSGRYYVYRPRP